MFTHHKRLVLRLRGKRLRWALSRTFNIIFNAAFGEGEEGAGAVEQLPDSPNSPASSPGSEATPTTLFRVEPPPALYRSGSRRKSLIGSPSSASDDETSAKPHHVTCTDEFE
jgi:hypothetical protein